MLLARAPTRRVVTDQNRALTPDVVSILSGTPPGFGVGQTHQLTWSVQAVTGDTVDPVMVCSSSDTAVATVHPSSGLVTAIGAGSATITIYPTGYPTVTAATVVTVLAQIPTTLLIGGGPISGLVGQTGIVRTATIVDQAGTPLTGQPVSWAIANPALASATADDASGDPVHSTTVSLLAVGATSLNATSFALSDSEPVVVSLTSGNPTFEVDFSQYGGSTAAMLADLYNPSTNPGGYWTTEPAHNTNRVSLLNEGPPGGTGWSMRYTWQRGATQLCTDFSIGPYLDMRGNMNQAWLEIVCRFSADWDTLAPGCTTSSNGYKFIFGRIRPPQPPSNLAQRFDTIIATQLQRNISYAMPGQPYVTQGNLNSSAYRDGNWHTWRFHCIQQPYASGRFRVWFDGVLKHDRAATTDGGKLWSWDLGANMNQQDANTTFELDWGIVRHWSDGNDPGW